MKKRLGGFMLIDKVTLTIKNGVLQKKDENYFGRPWLKIENISKIIVSGYREIEFYLKDNDDRPATIFVYGSNASQCADDYTFIKNEIETFYKIRKFSDNYFCGFDIISSNIIEPGLFLVEGLMVNDKESKAYRDSINIKDVVAFKRIFPKIIELTLKKGESFIGFFKMKKRL
jgi:hypothetical protein